MKNRSYERFRSRTAKIRVSAALPLLGLVALASMVGLSGCTGMVNADNKSTNSAVKVIPAVVNFGSTGVGKKVSHTASVTNGGTESVTLTKATVSDSEFSISGLRFPISIAAGQKANFTVWYKGSKPGKHNGTLSFDGASSSPDPVELTGSAANPAPSIEISATSHDFGKVTVNSVGTAALTIQNAGGSNLNISQILVTGPTFNANGIKHNQVIPAGGSAVLNLTFSPKAPGNYTGNVAIGSDDPDTPTKTVSLTGVGTTAAVGKLTASPASLSFSNVKVGSSATAMTTVKNVGAGNLTLSQVGVTGVGYSTTGVAAPALLVPGASVNVTVRFAPASAGASNGQISLASSEGTMSVSLSGTAVAATQQQPGLSVSPGNISFGSVVSGVTNTQTVQISNTGTAAVTITAANITGSGFATKGLSVPLTLNPSQSSTFSVQFAPTTAGSVSGILSLASNAPNSPSQISLTGTGAAATRSLSINPTSVSFGNVTLSNSASRNVTVTNTGNSDVAISSVTLTGAKFSLNGGSAVTLSPSQSITLNVQFSPTAAGASSGGISIASNATASPAVVSLSGTGVSAVQHTVALSWNASSNATGYNVYRSTVSGGGYSRINSSPDGGLSYTDSTVQSSQTYFYVTTAVNGSGSESNFSSEVSVNIP